jgi:hypothetical protein
MKRTSIMLPPNVKEELKREKEQYEKMLGGRIPYHTVISLLIREVRKLRRKCPDEEV